MSILLLCLYLVMTSSSTHPPVPCRLTGSLRPQPFSSLKIVNRNSDSHHSWCHRCNLDSFVYSSFRAAHYELFSAIVGCPGRCSQYLRNKRQLFSEGKENVVRVSFVAEEKGHSSIEYRARMIFMLYSATDRCWFFEMSAAEEQI